MSESKSAEDLQKVFELIKEGKAKEVDAEYWAAVDFFAQAQKLLTKLYTIAKMETGNDEEEQAKIANLYQQQSREYLHRARKCFIQALQLENEQDEKYREARHDEPLDTHPPKFTTITQEEAEKRLEIFTVLFSKESQRVGSAAKDEDDVEVDDKQSLLEERLMELNKSIPHGFKTSAERIVEINQGLRRLGLASYTEENRKELESLRPKSTHEQVADIIAQAKDEVKFDIHNEEPGVHKAIDHDDDDETSDADDDDEEGTESGFDDNDILLHRKAIRKQVVEAQIELANLVALLDKEQVPLDHAKAENEVDLLRGKKSLSDARRYLGKAIKLWAEDS